MIDKVNVFVALTHTGGNVGGNARHRSRRKVLFRKHQVKQEGDRAVLNAAVPLGFLRKMLAESEPAN